MHGNVTGKSAVILKATMLAAHAIYLGSSFLAGSASRS